MKVKIDTKERFVVITPDEPKLSANIAAELIELLNKTRHGEVGNVILKLPLTSLADDDALTCLGELQKDFSEHQASLVFCELQPAFEKQLANRGILEMLNVTKTESEAWDIVQMEEIERELMKDL